MISAIHDCWLAPSFHNFTNSWLSVSRISCSTLLSHARAALCPQVKSFQVNASKPWGYHLSAVLQQRDLGRFREPPRTLLSLFVALEPTLPLWAPLLHRIHVLLWAHRLVQVPQVKSCVKWPTNHNINWYMSITVSSQTYKMISSFFPKILDTFSRKCVLSIIPLHVVQSSEAFMT